MITAFCALIGQPQGNYLGISRRRGLWDLEFDASLALGLARKEDTSTEQHHKTPAGDKKRNTKKTRAVHTPLKKYQGIVAAQEKEETQYQHTSTKK
jgi:hypothetical protein